ncbi:hypothetical protein [Pontixanthobacter luteolus]|nr:hypothetical protein [Pontixanthobacter luteolus]
MPIWFELMVLLLVTYVIGLGLGWLVWGRSPDTAPMEDEGDNTP